MLKIAITGNIASGKSLFEKYLAAALKSLSDGREAQILCLDEVTKKLYDKSKELKEFLLKNFNTDKKEEVSKIVFLNPSALKNLENFIYPLILGEMNNFFDKNLNKPFCFVSAAMLFESGFNKYFDKIILVSAPDKIRLQRLMKRNGLSEDEALKRINFQQPEAEKAPYCDFILDNSKGPENLKTAANDIIKTLLQ